MRKKIDQRLIGTRGREEWEFMGVEVSFGVMKMFCK